MSAQTARPQRYTARLWGHYTNGVRRTTPLSVITRDFFPKAKSTQWIKHSGTHSPSISNVKNTRAAGTMRAISQVPSGSGLNGTRDQESNEARMLTLLVASGPDNGGHHRNFTYTKGGETERIQTGTTQRAHIESHRGAHKHAEGAGWEGGDMITRTRRHCPHSQHMSPV